jgi:hypothetical protein
MIFRVELIGAPGTFLNRTRRGFFLVTAPFVTVVSLSVFLAVARRGGRRARLLLLRPRFLFVGEEEGTVETGFKPVFAVGCLVGLFSPDLFSPAGGVAVTCDGRFSR